MAGRSRRSSDDPRIYDVRVHSWVHDDLAAIREYIAYSHPENGARYVEKLVAGISRLSVLPLAWPIARSLRRKNIRQMGIGSHRLIFRVDQRRGIVDVLGVAHGQQSLHRYWLAQRERGD